ncbi:hypothetical protein ENSA5_05180 [Enhygromyxa salina]|uniref:Uncharacterized protein n=1 Tax=Enhygromyxa salina TaxID=215803 RepID=A0A2S9YI07_9BACT|nr:hypothetical protein [Enhygromyxa salina]PRQ04753.1 hypothetical protein ENSA5_05180 [Enhygromyxa salina]
MTGSKLLHAAVLVLFGLLLPRAAFAAPPESEAAPAPEVAPAPEAEAEAAPEAATETATETDCSDGVDNDGDMVFDCGDHDCHDAAVCQPDGQPESNNARCSDWVDNDADGYLDCEDIDCQGVDACLGSWDRELAGQTVDDGKGPGDGGLTTTTNGPGPSLDIKAGEVEEDLQGRGGDKDGERSNYFCSDGFDNDGDGFTDCDDIGCKLGTEVTVCQPAGDIRFSVVARISQEFSFAGPEFGDKAVIAQPPNTDGSNDPDPRADENRSPFNTEFETLQMRVLGQIPFIQNSFFLLSMRAEKTPRLTFATFQVPIKNGHYVNVNSGGGGLSLELVRSVHKRMMVDPAYYVYNAFEQGNGAALEFGGPLDKRGKFIYRTFLAGGSGRFAGNVGGTFFPDDNRNFTWSGGAQVHMNLIGYYNRFDSPFLYTPASTAFTLTVGAKYDQRSQERYPAVNVQSTFRWKRLVLLGEMYGKRELNFKNWQVAFNVQLGVLAVKRRLLLSADFGQYLATPFENPPEELGSDLLRQLKELQYRFAAHIYLWRNVFLAQIVWRDRYVERAPSASIPNGTDRRTDLRVLLLYRF